MEFHWPTVVAGLITLFLLALFFVYITSLLHCFLLPPKWTFTWIFVYSHFFQMTLTKVDWLVRTYISEGNFRVEHSKQRKVYMPITWDSSSKATGPGWHGVSIGNKGEVTLRVRQGAGGKALFWAMKKCLKSENKNSIILYEEREKQSKTAWVLALKADFREDIMQTFLFINEGSEVQGTFLATDKDKSSTQIWIPNLSDY